MSDEPNPYQSPQHYDRRTHGSLKPAWSGPLLTLSTLWFASVVIMPGMWVAVSALAGWTCLVVSYYLWKRTKRGEVDAETNLGWPTW